MIRLTIEDAVIDWIIDYPETEVVIQELGIDHHCGGKSLEYACLEQGLDVQRVLTLMHQAIGQRRGETESS